jgi:hypothetical protein
MTKIARILAKVPLTVSLYILTMCKPYKVPMFFSELREHVEVILSLLAYLDMRSSIQNV